jgi:hypothetical protein
VGTAATVNVVLKPGTVKQEVTVTATGEVLLEEDNGSLGTVIDAHQMQQLPLLGRNPYSLVNLAPGVMPEGNTGTGPNINGGLSNTSGILLDGAETRNNTTNDNTYTPPLETVAEFRVITNNFSAEYGRSGGGILTVAGQTGTNALHGSVYEFLRNNDLNANGWTNNRAGLPRTGFHRNEFGSAAGGPVVIPRLYNGANRTFFFLNFEMIRQAVPDNVIASVPTAAQRVGDFSQTFGSNGSLIQIFDPNAAQQVSGNWTRQQFPGNQIPQSRINPISNNVLGYYPLPNLPGLINNYALPATRASHNTRGYYRADHNIGSANRIFVRQGFESAWADTPFPNDIAFPGEGTNGTQGLTTTFSQSGSVSDTSVIRPNLIGEFRFSMTRGVWAYLPRSTDFDFTKLGLPAYLKNDALGLKFPRFDITDESSIGPASGSNGRDAETNYQWQANVTWLHGAHSVRAGGNMYFFAFNVFRPNYEAGDYSFSRAYTQGPSPTTASVNGGYGFATFLLGTPTGGSFTQGSSLANSQRAYTWYLQDDWKLRRKFTINLGIRWEYQTPWTERYNHLAVFDPTAPVPGSSTLKGMLEFVGENGASRYQGIPQKTNYAPRLGWAYELARNTVLRGGYGIFFFPGSGGIGSGASDLGSGWQIDTPVYLGPPAAAPNSPSPGGSLTNPFYTGLLTPPTNGLGGSASAPFANWMTPFIQQWNVNIQRIVTRGLMVEAAYIGTRSEHLWFNIQADGVDPDYLSLGKALSTVVPNPYYGVVSVGNLSAKNVSAAELLEPFPQYNSVAETRASIGDGIYHAFTLKVEKRMQNGLQFQASYTISKLLTDIPERFNGRSSIIDPYNLHLSRSLGDWDRPQFFVANFIYELPFGDRKRWAAKGLASKILGNWQVAGIFTLGKGIPVVITGPSNTQISGIGAAAVRLRSPVLPAGQQSMAEWFDTSAFAPAPAYSLGNDSRTEPNLRGPGLVNLDASLSRSHRIRERVILQFRAEFFSATNTPQLSPPSGSLTALDFGQVDAAGGGTRNVQLGLRMTY